jgi:ribosomal protein L20A (L18A)
MKTYEVKGTFLKKGKTHKFSSKSTAENEKLVKEKVLSQLGSKQKITRVNITIESVKEAK